MHQINNASVLPRFGRPRLQANELPAPGSISATGQLQRNNIGNPEQKSSTHESVDVTFRDVSHLVILLAENPSETATHEGANVMDCSVKYTTNRRIYVSEKDH